MPAAPPPRRQYRTLPMASISTVWAGPHADGWFVEDSQTLSMQSSGSGSGSTSSDDDSDSDSQFEQQPSGIDDLENARLALPFKNSTPSYRTRPGCLSNRTRRRAVGYLTTLLRRRARLVATLALITVSAVGIYSLDDDASLTKGRFWSNPWSAALPPTENEQSQSQSPVDAQLDALQAAQSAGSLDWAHGMKNGGSDNGIGNHVAPAQGNKAAPSLDDEYGAVPNLVHRLPRRPISMQSHGPLLANDAACLELWLTKGEVCDGLDLSMYASMDGVWNWVNGSDPRHIASRAFYAGKKQGYAVEPPRPPTNSKTHNTPNKTTERSRGSSPVLQNTDNRFRDNDELLYSLRSAHTHLGRFLRTYHVISTDFWAGGQPDPGSAAGNGINDQDNAANEASTKTRTSPSNTSPPDVPVAVGASASGFVQPTFAAAASMVQVNSKSEEGEGKQFSHHFRVEGGRWREGQVPQWLDTSRSDVITGEAARSRPELSLEPRSSQQEEEHAPQLRLHHDWNTFHNLRSVDPVTQALAPYAVGQAEEEREEKERLRWKSGILPTFNSVAAEAMMGDLPGLTENFFYSNDDFFLGRDLSSADFFSPLYGPVLHMQSDLKVRPWADAPARLGEWPSIHYSSWLLSQRFGRRDRPYIMHTHKTMSRPLLLESKLIWGDEFGVAAKNRFRGQGKDANTHFLQYHMIVERHREALLWTYFMLRLDTDGDNLYSSTERARLLSELGALSPIDKLRIKWPRRTTLSSHTFESSLRSAHFPVPLQSAPEFSSMDEYLSTEMQGTPRQSSWPVFAPVDKGDESRFDRSACAIDLDVCLGEAFGEGTRVDEVFTDFAFRKPKCGDCLIMHLISQSGPQGLSAFLPSADLVFPESASSSTSDTTNDAVPPHLPLTKTWSDSNFTLSSIISHNPSTHSRSCTRRVFALRLIQRYQYIIAGASAHFSKLETVRNSRFNLGKLRTDRPAFICLNDDIEGERETILEMVGTWFAETFPQRLPWERLHPPRGPGQEQGKRS